MRGRVETKIALAVGAPGSGSLPKKGVDINIKGLLDELKNCNVHITPNCLRALYEFPPGISANAQNSYGIVEYTPQSFLQGDLDLFFANFSKAQKQRTPIIDSIDGGAPQTTNEGFQYNGESDLDLEYAMTLVNPQKVTLYQTGDFVEGASFNNFLDAIDGSYCTFEGGDDPTQDATYPDPLPGGYTGPENCGGFAATKVISTSYGYNEADLTPAYEQRQCAEYMKLGLA
jgi:tripeptidyl-peptidase-1